MAQVAASLPRSLTFSTAVGYLAACLEADRPFPWDRRRLGIDASVENEVSNTRPNACHVLQVPLWPNKEARA